MVGPLEEEMMGGEGCKSGEEGERERESVCVCVKGGKSKVGHGPENTS